MNSEKERMLLKKEKCGNCKFFSKAKYGYKFLKTEGFCKRVVDGEDVYVNDFKIDVIYHINTVTTTENSSCGFWRKI